MKPWLGLLVLVSLAPACSRARDPNEDVLKIGAYSVVREVLHDGLLPAFVKAWKSEDGPCGHVRRVVHGVWGPGTSDFIGV